MTFEFNRRAFDFCLIGLIIAPISAFAQILKCGNVGPHRSHKLMPDGSRVSDYGPSRTVLSSFR